MRALKALAALALLPVLAAAYLIARDCRAIRAYTESEAPKPANRSGSGGVYALEALPNG